MPILGVLQIWRVLQRTVNPFPSGKHCRFDSYHTHHHERGEMAAYVKFDDLPFVKPEHRTICEQLYKDISAVEDQLVTDEGFAEHLSSILGAQAANELVSPTLGLNKRVLLALKIAFWYYSGKSPHNVVDGPRDDELDIDIFNPVR